MRERTLKEKCFAVFLLVTCLSYQPSLFAFQIAPSQNPALSSQDIAVRHSYRMLAHHLEKSMIQSAIQPANHLESKDVYSDYLPAAFFFTRHHTLAKRIFGKVLKYGIAYEAFEVDAHGALQRRIETGYFQKDRFILERVFDYERQAMTLYNPSNVYEKRVYQLLPDGRTGRPLQYRGRSEAGELVQVRFLYDDQARTVTCLHLRDMQYAVYEKIGETQVGKLLEIGSALGVKDQKVIPAQSIQLSTLQRSNEILPVYIFEQIGQTGYVMRERLQTDGDELGVIGRILRYASNEWDLEYFYEDSKTAVNQGMMILNHRSGEAMRFEIPVKALADQDGRVTRAGKEVSGETLKGIQSSGKFLMAARTGIFIHRRQGGLVFSYHPILRSQDIWEGFLRGPPSSKPNFLKLLSGMQSLHSLFFSTCFQSLLILESPANLSEVLSW